MNDEVNPFAAPNEEIKSLSMEMYGQLMNMLGSLSDQVLKDAVNQLQLAIRLTDKQQMVSFARATALLEIGGAVANKMTEAILEDAATARTLSDYYQVCVNNMLSELGSRGVSI